MSQTLPSFGPYQVLAKLGEGGMGEVYRANDTRLDRLVALKVSKTDFDERFAREARAVAALSHPHICALYDVGSNYLVMELVDGVPLAGPLPVEQAVAYASQILDALDAAHRKGITHRDLKPANILVTKHGIKLLDFGLAKQTTGPLGEAQATMSALTSQGQILGTLQYMAPEQLQGQPTDARADLFAFGCVLYELLSGKRAFDGSSPASVIAAILERQPAPLSTHPPLDRVIATCLAKNPADRFQTPLDTKRAMQWAMEQPTASASTLPASRRRERVAIAIAAASIAVAAAVVGWPSSNPGSSIAAPRMQVSIDMPVGGNWGVPAFSPDGSRIAFIASGGIAVRAIDSIEGQLIAMPAPFEGSLAWSPDGQSLAFCGANAELQSVAISGGATRTLGATCGPFVRGTAWTAGGEILFSTVAGMWRMPAAGGTAKPVGEDRDQYPTMLPDGRHYLFLRSGGIRLGAIDSTDSRSITDADSRAAFTSGHLVFMRGTTLMAQPFDSSRLEATGDAVPIASDARIMAVSRTGYFSVAPNGLIVFTTGGVGRTALTWIDRSGKVLSVVDDRSFHQDLALSDDGRMLADTRVSPKTLRPNLWVTDLSRGISTRLTPETEDVNGAAWSPDGGRLAYWSSGLQVRDSAGTTPPVQVAAPGPIRFGPPGFASWFPDGRSLVFVTSGDAQTLSTVSLDDGHKTAPYLKVPSSHPAVSPDGRWMAYAADESGQFNVFVESIPAGRGKWRISSDGGAQPIWRRDGRELFYRATDGGIMAVPTSVGEAFNPGRPTLLFNFDSFGVVSIRRQYAVSPDGQRFLVNKLIPDSGRTILLQNWLPQTASSR